MSRNNFKSIILHLRLPFSLLLLPVFLFAISSSPKVNNIDALLVFLILHLLIYPSSNAYNSYFDKDEGSIALIKSPPKVERSLYYTAISLEWIGALFSFFVNWQFAVGVIVYNSLSKAYSHPSVRLKRLPIASFFLVFFFQGAFVYYTCFFAFNGFGSNFTLDVFMAGLICSCLIGASYPLTLIYQHEEDAKRGDKTLSILLGYKGSFYFSAIVFVMGLMLMFTYWNRLDNRNNFYVFLLCCLPILSYFIWWFIKVVNNINNANFSKAMRMTLISGSMMLFYFTWLCLFA